MKTRLSYLIAICFSILLTQRSSAQTIVDTGREVRRGEVNFSVMAAYLLAHPTAPAMHDLDNDEDGDVRPYHPPITDPSMIHSMATAATPAGGPASYGPLTLLPVSPAPTDSFESTLDPGTAIPPDTHGAVDANYCVTAINTNITIQTRAGGAVSSVSLDGFWSSVVSGGTYDPRVHYDQYAGRWIIVTDVNAESDSSAILIAVSKTGDPTGSWWTYMITADATGVNWLDYPCVGFNSKWITVTGNLFGVSGSGSFYAAKVFVFDKASLLSGAGAPYTSFLHTTSFTICPAVTYDATEPNLFAVETWNGTASGGGLMRLWKITGAVGAESMDSIGFPESAGVNWQGSSFAVSGTAGADFAPQVGTSNLIQTNDDRVFQLVYQNGYLWYAHTIFLPYSTTANPTRSSIQWWQIDTNATPLQIGYIDDNTGVNFYGFPSIAVNSSNDALVGFSAFSATTHPSAAYAVHIHTDPVDSMRPLDIFRHGQNTYYKTFSGTKNRWGDFSAAVVDPVDNYHFWTIQEASSATADTWDTWWAYVQPCTPPGATITAGGALSFCAGGSVALNANTGTGYTYQWQLGGSSISGATGASYTASTGGSYTVLVTALTCTSTSSATVVTVNALPTATITPAGSTTFCTGGSVVLNATAGAGYTYQWLNSSGIITGATAASYTASAASGYSVVITTSSGCTATSATTTVVINSLPSATITPVGATTFCAGGSVALNATAGAGYMYQWKLGSALIGGATGVSYSASTSGNYTVIVTNAAGCSATSSATPVSVNPLPAAITGTPTVCVGATTHLSDDSTGGTWSSGSPSVATVSGAGVVTGAGTGGVAAIVYTLPTGCTASINVSVNGTVAAPITGASGICIGGTASFTDATPGGTWSTSDPTKATIASSGMAAGVAAGAVTISYLVSGVCGADTATLPLTVSAGSAVAAISGSLTVCLGSTATLTDATPLGVWTSSSPSVATIDASGVVTGATVSSDVINYTVTNASGCATTVSATINVFTSSAATIAAAGATTFCTGGYVELNASSGTSYQWQKDGVNITGATAAGYLADSSGSYTVTLTFPGGCTSASAPIVVTVSAAPIAVPAVHIAASPGTVLCGAPSPVVFTAVADSGGASPVYQWYVNGTAVSTAASYTYTPASGDVVKILLTSDIACAFPDTASATASIFISPGDTAALSISVSPTVACAGDTITATAIPVLPGASPIYHWTKNGVSAYSGPVYQYMFSNGDILVCTMISDFPCLYRDTVVSTPYTVHVDPLVANSVTIFASEMSIVPGQLDSFVAVAPYGGASPTYQWLKNGVAIPGATNALYITTTLAAGDEISCEETTSALCASPLTILSGGIKVAVHPVAVQQVTTNNGNFTLVPNPNKGTFTIQGSLKQPADKVSIVVTDMLGQVIYKRTTQAQNGSVNEEIILANTVASGMYLVSITSGGDHAVFNVVVEK